MEVRPAIVWDAAGLARVHVDSWRAAYRDLVPEAFLVRFTCRRAERRFRSSLAAGVEETHVLQIDQETVGFVTLAAVRDPDLDAERTGEIWGMYIAPGHRRRGIGRRLAEEAEAILRSSGHEQGVLWVLEANGSARRFDEALGYGLDGTTKQIDWGAPLQAIRYGRVLRRSEAQPCR